MKEEKETDIKKGGWKLKIIAFFLLAATGGFIYFYYWYQDTNQLRQEASALIQRAQTYDMVISEMKTEYDRCQVFISQQEGSFGNFEYCKGYTQWYKGLNLN